MLRKGYGGLYKSLTKEERRTRTAKRRERDKIKFIDLRFEKILNWFRYRHILWCHGAVVKHADSTQGCEFDSSMWHL